MSGAPKYHVKTRHLIGHAPFSNPFRPHQKRRPIYSNWKKVAKSETLAGAKELRREHVVSEIRLGWRHEREWAIFKNRRIIDNKKFGKGVRPDDMELGKPLVSRESQGD
jgi:hypothetical protein